MLSIINGISGAACGAALGSFFCCAAYRLPRQISLLGRSYCPACRQQLQDSWNIPLFSWLALRGRSACCQTTIPVRYLTYELVGTLLGAGAGWFVGWEAVAGAALIVMVLTAGLSALRRHRWTP